MIVISMVVFAILVLSVPQRDGFHFAAGMLNRKKRPYNPDQLQPVDRLRANYRDLYGDNALSARRMQSLLDDTYDAGLDVGLSRPAHKRSKNNMARTTRRKFLKRCQWPKLYWARIRVKNVRTDREEWQTAAFMLPHEYLHVLHHLGNDSVVYDISGLDPRSKSHLDYCQAQAGDRLVALGLWGDGAPCNWDRSESVETFTLNLPGQGGEYKTLRLPLTAISRKQVSEHTWDDIMTVLTWSLTHAASGTWPRNRHDGTQWWKTDAWRKRKSTKVQLGVKGALVEVRGDWKFYAECFHFPKWNTKAGCCWTCGCTPDQVGLLQEAHVSYIYIYIYIFIC